MVINDFNFKGVTFSVSLQAKDLIIDDILSFADTIVK
jgi:hypothetical protein